MFGPKDGKFVGTTIDGALVKFCLGSKDAPLRAPFGISEPFQEGETTHSRTMDLDDYPTAGDVMAPDGSCHTYQPDTAPLAVRLVGSSRATEAQPGADDDLVG